MAKMTKSQIIAALAEKSGMAKKDVVTLMDTLAELAYAEVKGRGEFVVPGFGKMVKVNRKARMGVNPATGAKIQIKASRTVGFRPSKDLRKSV